MKISLNELIEPHACNDGLTRFMLQINNIELIKPYTEL